MIDKETVERIADLARIEVSQEQDLRDQLSKIIDYVDKLKEVNTKGVEPLRNLQQHPIEEPLREDKAGENLSRQDILNNAPALLDDYFKIPRVMK